jgi:two-component system chemotaxis response regulator CheY
MSIILIVDDSPTIRRMVKASLSAMSAAAFTEAASGLEAIETLAVAHVDALVLDLNMPDMHGLDVLRFVRSHDQYKKLPIIVLTTRNDAVSRDAALQAGASAYMTKPFTPSVLFASLRDLLDAAEPKPDAGAEPMSQSR